MSTSHEIWCLDCNVGSGHYDGPSDYLRALIKVRSALEVFEEARRAGPPDFREYRVMHWTGNNPAPTEFFLAHRGHRLMVRDEYGRFDDSCGEWFKCSECGTGHACSRLMGHEGAHSTRRGAP